jgi:tetratricopeptide (TPR) repeat protein
VKSSLEKLKFMYYPMYQNVSGKFRLAAAVILFSVSLFVCLSPIFAENIMQPAAQDYRVQGYEAQQKGNYDQALVFYLKAISLGDKTALLYNDIGVVYEELGVFDRAQENYEQAIAEDPQYLSAYSNLAYMFKEQGNKEKALEYFRKRYELSGTDDPKKEKIFEEILALDPTYKQRLIRSELETTSQALQQKAQDEFNQDVARSERHFQKGQQYLQEKNYEKALLEIDRALGLTPQNPKLVRAKEQVLHEQKIAEVKARTNEALKKLDAGELDAAKAEFQNILAIIPNEPVQKSE